MSKPLDPWVMNRREGPLLTGSSGKPSRESIIALDTPKTTRGACIIAVTDMQGSIWIRC